MVRRDRNLGVYLFPETAPKKVSERNYRGNKSLSLSEGGAVPMEGGASGGRGNIKLEITIPDVPSINEEIARIKKEINTGRGDLGPYIPQQRGEILLPLGEEKP